MHTPGDPITVPLVLIDYVRLLLSLRKQTKTGIMILTTVIESCSPGKMELLLTHGGNKEYEWYIENPLEHRSTPSITGVKVNGKQLQSYVIRTPKDSDSLGIKILVTKPQVVSEEP